MRFPSQTSLRTCVLISLLATMGAAQAHTGHGTTSLFEGLVHPLGSDHLLAMLAVGLWSVSALPAGKVWWGPMAFMAALMVSAALGVMGMTVPFLELLLALSVAMFGLLLVMVRMHMPAPLGLGLVALAASLHGIAHGAETPANGFAAYAIGFLATTAVLHVSGVAIGLLVRSYLARQAPWVLIGTGSLLSGAGIYLAAAL